MREISSDQTVGTRRGREPGEMRGLLLAAALSGASAPGIKPMNRGRYHLANPLDPAADGAEHFRGESFDVLGPEAETHYGEVHWRPELTPLPADIVKRFDDKVMAVTGCKWRAV